MNRPWISVIMLTYNRENMVAKAIESVLAQTFKDFEFIIVDNGSTDRSGAIADEYAAKDSRIHVIQRERGNIGSGRNAGLDAAKGEYVAFIDDDDWAESDYLEFLYMHAVENNADIAICGADKNDNDKITFIGVDDGAVLMDAEDAIVSLMWRKRFNNGFPTKLFKRSLLTGVRFPETGRYDDIHLMYKVLANAKKIIYHGLPKYHVYRHDGNNSSATTKDSMITPEYLNEYRGVYRERTEWLCEHFPDRSDYWWYFDWSFMLSMLNKIVSNQIRGCETQFSEMQFELSKCKRDFLACQWAQDFEKEWMEKYII